MRTYIVRTLLVTLTTAGFIRNIVICGREKTTENLYCLPVYNCPPGKYVKTCIHNNTQDVCEVCRDGVQPNYVSSFDNETWRNCFVPTDIDQCPKADTVHSREPYPANWCPHKCRCDVTKCFWGPPCICYKRDVMCRENEELDSVTGECRRCPEGKIKNDPGCGPCLVDVDKMSKAPYPVHDQHKTQVTEGIYSKHTVTKQSQPGRPANQKVVSSTAVPISTEPVGYSDQSDDGQECNSTRVYLIALIVAGVLIVLLLIVLTYTCCRRQRLPNNHDTGGKPPNLLSNGNPEDVPLTSRTGQ